MPPSKLTFKEQMSGFPVWQILVTSMVRFAEPILFTSLFPYVYFMVRDFGVAEKKEDIAKYVGYLSSSFAFCQFLSSIHWGHLADVIGRKKILITGLSLNACALLIFGFAKSYTWLLVARSMMGLFNGNILVIRTALGEIAVHKRHQAIAFSTLPLLWQLGTIIGPFIGGALTNVDVDREYSYQVKGSYAYRAVSPVIGGSTLDDFVSKHPYALSNIVVSSGLVCCAIICFLFFEETHYELKYKKDIGVEIGDSLIRKLGYEPPARPWHQLHRNSVSSVISKQRVHSRRQSSILGSVPITQRANSLETTPLLEQLELSTEETNSLFYEETADLSSLDSSDSDTSVHSIPLMSRRLSVALIRTYSKRANLISDELERNNSSGYEWGVLLAPQVFFAIFSNFALSLTNIVVDEFLPVFLAQETEREHRGDLKSPLISKFPFKIVGGMNFDPSEVGNLLSLSGTIGVILVIFFYPWIDRTFLPVKSFRFFISMTPFVDFLIPFLVFTLPPNTPSLAYTKLALYVVAFFKVLSNSICFPQIMLLIHRASPAKNRSFINGTTISVTSAARCIGPFWGEIMSWADKHEMGGLTWWSLTFVAILSVIPSFLLKEPEDENGEETTIIEEGEA